MKKQKKYYAVVKGINPGIYANWEETKTQVNGFPGAIYKSFKTQKEAADFIKDPSGEKKTGAPIRSITMNRELEPKDCIIVYVDGGSLGNPGPGGYGIVIDGWEKISSGFQLTTNNRMELMAVIKTLENLIDSNKKIIIYSDSSYVINGINKGWVKNWEKNKWFKSNGEPVLNSDLWKNLLELTGKIKLELRKVKGHSGDPLNEEADQLAKAAARSKAFFQDTEYLKSIQSKSN
jgi:ribonuclease HI